MTEKAQKDQKHERLPQNAEDQGAFDESRRKILKKAAYTAPSLLVLGTLGTVKTGMASSFPECEVPNPPSWCPPPGPG